VFEAILEKAHSLCGVTIGALEVWDGQAFRVLATRGLPAQFEELIRERPVRPGPFVQRLLHDGFIHSIDLAEVDDPLARASVELAGVRTTLHVALRKDGALLGQIVAARREVRPFSEKQIALLQNFAAQAVIAMENARLLGELRQRTDQVAELNRGLEARVAEQVEELGRVGRLKRFLAPQLAELIVSQGDEKILESHRREIVVVFCDLRGYTAFTETAEPEEVLDFLREYHGALGPLVSQYEGSGALPRPGPARRQDGDGDARRGGQANLDLAPRRLRTWFQRRHRTGLRHLGPDRLFRTLRLHRDRHGMQPRRTAVCRGEGRADPDQQPRRSRGRGGCDPGGSRKPGAEGSSPSSRGIQCDGTDPRGCNKAMTWHAQAVVRSRTHEGPFRPSRSSVRFFSIAANVKPRPITSYRPPSCASAHLSHGALASLRGRRRAAS